MGKATVHRTRLKGPRTRKGVGEVGTSMSGFRGDVQHSDLWEELGRP